MCRKLISNFAKNELHVTPCYNKRKAWLGNTKIYRLQHLEGHSLDRFVIRMQPRF